MKLAVSLALFSAVVSAQSKVTLGKVQACGQTQNQLVLLTPITPSLSIPVCIALDPIFTVSNGKLSLNLPAQATPSRLIAERVPLANVVQGTPSITVTLSKTPVSSSTILVFLRSSFVGEDRVDFGQVDSTQPKTLVLNLPTHRAWTANDDAVVVYTSNEP